MISRGELLNDQETAMREMLDGRQSCIWTAMPGIVTAVHFDDMTVEVQLTIKGQVQGEDGNYTDTPYPKLVKVPIVFPSAGGFTITMPIAVDDEVLVVFASRAIDSWWQSSGIQEPIEDRMHDLSDGFAIPGPKSVPKKISGISTTKLQIRNNAGNVVLGVGTKFSMVNASTDLKTLLSDLTSALSTFLSALSALPPTPVSGAALSVPAATAVSSIASVVTEINALLEAT